MKQTDAVRVIDRLMTVAKLLAKNNQQSKPNSPRTADTPAKNTKRQS